MLLEGDKHLQASADKTGALMRTTPEGLPVNRTRRSLPLLFRFLVNRGDGMSPLGLFSSLISPRYEPLAY